MSEVASPASPAAGQAQPAQGRSWKQVVFQIIMFQLVMRFFSPKTQPQEARDPITGELIPPLHNAYSPGFAFDLYVHISPNSTATLRELSHTTDPVWFSSDELYTYNRQMKDRKTNEPIYYRPSKELFDVLLTQHHNPKPIDLIHSKESVLETLSGISKIRRLNERRRDWDSIYLIASVVPHSAYHNTSPSPLNLEEARDVLKEIDYDSDEAQLIVTGTMNLIEYMKPIGNRGLQSLLDSSGHDDDSKQDNQPEKEEEKEPHWKNHIDIRFVVDQTSLTPKGVTAPHLQRFIKPLPERGVYLPILYPSDMWLLERNYIHLNETLRETDFELTISFNTLNMLWWSLQSQLGDIWNPTGEGPINPLMALQSHSRRETFMLKRVILDTNPFILAFSAAFMLLHTVFSFLAFKNDIQFWHRNDSMEGLSVLSIVFSFICELVIALYLYDSEETSFLIMFEIFLGLALSAWKVTKAINISVQWKQGSMIPLLSLQDKKNYNESDTKKYDQIAIKFMSIVLLPCCLGYAGYALKYKKYKSWYSYIVSTLAGTVYTFGFIMMTPQLYINYKLKSVDHLPWRAFTYKALNTFVDDIAAFIIDMPWMHRLACFRDDIIFVCYLYQRWIYSVDKTRPSEWVPSQETEQFIKEKEEKLKNDTEETTTLLTETTYEHSLKHRKKDMVEASSENLEELTYHVIKDHNDKDE